MSTSLKCQNCGSTDITTDHVRYEKVCAQCSSVVEESRIVSEVTFGESSSGAAVVTGSYVGHDQAGPGGGGRFGHSESRAQTIEKTRARIYKVAERLAIPEYIAQAALQYFKLALNRNFVKGRKSQYVVSACLYVACRRARTTHMLMDFAEVIYVNVFQIGATYLQLVKTLNIKDIPLVDPSIFIERFTAQLSFGDEGGKRVREDANKLAQRMNRDWLVEGRRPAGIAAACVLLAARMNNFRRSKSEIVQVAKIAEETIQRRLDEFKTTSAGTLTISDFRNTQIETQADPPSFTRHRMREAREEERLARGEVQEEVEDALITEMIRDIDKQDAVLSRIKSAPKEDGAERDEFDDEDDEQQEGGIEDDVEKEADEKEIALNGAAGEEEDADVAAVTAAVAAAVDEEVGDIVGNRTRSSATAKSKDKRPPKQSPTPEEPEQPAETGETEKRIESEIDLTLHDPNFKEASKAWQVIKKYREKRKEKIAANTQGWVSEVRDDPEHLSDVDDDEVDSFILTEREVEIKSRVWMSLHRDYLIEQENKRLKIEADIKAGIYKAPRKRKRRTKQEDRDAEAEDMPAPSAAESAKRMMQSRAFSKRINYNMFDMLFKKKKKDGEDAAGNNNESNAPAASSSTVES